MYDLSESAYSVLPAARKKSNAPPKFNVQNLEFAMTAGNSKCKAAWVEPEVLTLNVLETAGLPRRGSDSSIHIDCTRS